jgi:uncharacterized Zn-binding protein involved in type VI secretion
MFDGPKPHVGGPIIPPNSTTVQADGLFQARATDKATCAGPPDFIVTGSSTVLVNGLMAARQLDMTMHGGLLTKGSTTVLIGGPTAGATLGNPAAAKAQCNANGAQQSYNNCGVESSRQLIAKNGKSIGQDALLDDAIAHGDADDARNRTDAGGTNPSGRRDILARHGVPSTLEPQGMASITQGVAEGKGVITSHEASILWGPGHGSGGHAIVVTGLTYDANGKLVTVTTNDTGIGECGREVDADQFEKSLRPGRDVNVTTNPIW